MPKILIDILPAKGHFYGSFKLVLKLKEFGYQVVYLNMEPLKDELDKNGFEDISSANFINPILLSKQKFNFKLFFDKLFDFNRKETFKREKSQFRLFKEFINKISPDLVLLDEQNMLKAVYYQMCNIPVVCVETKPEPCKFENMPPFTSFFVPSNTFKSKCLCRFLWFIKTIQNRYRLKKLQFNLFGTDYYSTACRLARQNKIDLKKRTDLERGYGIGIKDIPRLIAAPAAFDFPHAEKEGTFNIGPLVDISREGEIEKSRYNILRKKLEKFKNKESGFIIYCSLGTITGAFQNRVKSFFKRTIKVALQNPSDLFVLSAGMGFNVSELFPVPDNMYIFDYVPQVDLLPYCDIMITHGGINSITECIFCGVPTLNYPLSLEWDQPGCAARAVYHKVGLMGKINKDSPKTISKKLNQIKSNYSFYKKNVLSMKEKFEEKNNSDEVIEIIENILNKTKQK